MSRLIGSYPAGTLSCTGGVASTPGDGFKYHVFTSSGNFNITGEAEPSNPVGSLLLKSPTEIELECLVVGGGGGGGGGGAGGLVHGTDNFLVGTKTITVGGGGGWTTSGTPSVFDTITALGGGRAGYNANSGLATGAAGGSGGAGGWYGGGRPGGAGLQPGSASGGFGNAGGTGAEGGGSGGGGGAGGIGQNFPTRTGGLGKEYTQFATIGGDPDAPGWFASGGSGYTTAATPFVAGPSGGGGDGSGSSGGGSNGAVNTGGGSGAGGGTGGTGGSGVVIIRYAV